MIFFKLAFRFRWVGPETNSRLNRLRISRRCRDEADLGLIYILFSIIVLDISFCGIAASIPDLHLALTDHCG